MRENQKSRCHKKAVSFLVFCYLLYREDFTASSSASNTSSSWRSLSLMLGIHLAANSQTLFFESCVLEKDGMDA